MTPDRGPRRPPRRRAALVALPLLLALAACTSSAVDPAASGAPASRPSGSAPGSGGTAASTGTGGAPSNGAPASTPPGSTPSGSAPAAASGSPAGGERKVMVIAEENEDYDNVIGARSAPYINGLAKTFGTATAMDAGYPGGCPSLAAYILLTSGDRQRICDDGPPASHKLAGDSIYGQVAAAGKQWRGYAESMPANCYLTNSADGLYLVRHAPAPYYLRERAHCRDWDVPLGTLAAGHLHDDVTAGTLPAYSFVTPNACNDMHGAASCTKAPVASGDAWLKQWMPAIMAGPDYRSGRLVILIVWDEGSVVNNHVPAIIVSPSTRAISNATRWTHCSTLRTAEELLGLPPLGCAAKTTSLVAAFRLNVAG